MKTGTGVRKRAALYHAADGSEIRVRVEKLGEKSAPMRTGVPADAARYWRERITHAPWFDPQKEAFVVLCLNARLDATSFALVCLGTLNANCWEVRETFRPAVAAAAYAVIAMHNHPSGDPSPSPGDALSTQRIVEAGRLLGIEVLDHVIIGRGESYFSFREADSPAFHDLPTRGGVKGVCGWCNRRFRRPA